MKSIIYWHPVFYYALMQIIYKGKLKEHYTLLAKEIDNLKVLDLCCADGRLADFLINKKNYLGIDINHIFVKSAKKKGIEVKKGDILDIEWPETDCIILMGSLYQFYPNHDSLVKKMLNHASKKVILSEVHTHLADSKNRFISFLARNLTGINNKANENRFNRADLLSIFKKHNASRIIDTGKDIIGIFEKTVN